MNYKNNRFELYALPGPVEQARHLHKKANSDLAILLFIEPDKEVGAFLEKVLGAVNHSWNQVHAIIVTENQRLRFIPWANNSGVKKVIVFGPAPAQLGLYIDPPANQEFSLRGMQFLFTSTPSELMDNQELKKMLWAGLQEMFGLDDGRRATGDQ